MLEIGSLLDGKYKILNEIGHGGMSVVYLALNERANKTWAVKEVRKDGGNDTTVVSQNLVAETEMLKKLDHAYAVTIHKSQGSEYNAVILPLTSVSRNLLYRNLLYTGVTRAKNILIIIGKRSQVATMVENNRKTLRYSCVKPLLMLETSKEKKDEVL